MRVARGQSRSPHVLSAARAAIAADFGRTRRPRRSRGGLLLEYVPGGPAARPQWSTTGCVRASHARARTARGARTQSTAPCAPGSPRSRSENPACPRPAGPSHRYHSVAAFAAATCPSATARHRAMPRGAPRTHARPCARARTWASVVDHSVGRSISVTRNGHRRSSKTLEQQRNCGGAACAPRDRAATPRAPALSTAHTVRPPPHRPDSTAPSRGPAARICPACAARRRQAPQRARPAPRRHRAERVVHTGATTNPREAAAAAGADCPHHVVSAPLDDYRREACDPVDNERFLSTQPTNHNEYQPTNQPPPTPPRPTPPSPTTTTNNKQSVRHSDNRDKHTPTHLPSYPPTHHTRASMRQCTHTLPPIHPARTHVRQSPPPPPPDAHRKSGRRAGA